MRRLPNEQRTGGFTIVEVLVVMAIILVLAGLVLGTSSYVHNKAARSRAEAEIAAMSAALENYKADNGVYPSNTDTDGLDAKANSINLGDYEKASLVLYEKLSGDLSHNGNSTQTSYMTFKDNQLQHDNSNLVQFIKDPFGNSYGYSTEGQAAASSGQAQAGGYNPTFDLWSTAGATTSTAQAGWIKNW